MSNAPNNSDGGEILASITWQYDSWSDVVGVVKMLKDFFDQSTKEYFDGFAERYDLSNPNIGAFGLSIWGKLLALPRPFVTIGGEYRPISDATYRTLLLARVQLFGKDATIDSIKEYLVSVFGDGNVSVLDARDMSLAISFSGLSEELSALVTQHPSAVIIEPAGVRATAHSDALMFGLSADGVNPQDALCGGLGSSKFCWRYTPKGNWR